jgi:EAL domain-containing protein (putative c-di-GMP-specific phosphodiesterase class I)/GGDEF domain-containing protein
MINSMPDRAAIPDAPLTRPRRSVAPAPGWASGTRREAHADLAEVRAQRNALRWLATHSSTTNLLNRDGFVSTVNSVLIETMQRCCVIWFELEELHVIRQTFGFAAGDAALCAAVARLQDFGQALGGVVGQPEDSALVVMIPSVGGSDAWGGVVQSLLHELARPYTVMGLSVMAGPCAGWASGGPEGGAEALLRQAKTASWTACRAKVPMLQWRAGLDAEQAKRAALLGDFAAALTNDELHLEFQPKFDALTHRLIGAEALARWTHPDKGRVMPSDFIPTIELSGFCRPFTLWGVRRALGRWTEITDVCPDAKVAINVPVALLSDAAFVEAMLEEIAVSGTRSSCVQIEITERGLDGNLVELRTGLSRLQLAGISVALDDFGTGQSSLAFLRRLPIQEVKIDRSFIEQLDVDDANQAVVAACVAIARTGSQTVCAEGVETHAELRAAVRLGCHAVQGYLTGRPMPIEALVEVAANSCR